MSTVVDIARHNGECVVCGRASAELFSDFLTDFYEFVIGRHFFGNRNASCIEVFAARAVKREILCRADPIHAHGQVELDAVLVLSHLIKEFGDLVVFYEES